MAEDSWGGEVRRPTTPNTPAIVNAGVPAITVAMMYAAGADPMRTNAYLLAVNSACHEFEIDVVPLRAAHFLAQIAHESEGFRYTSEVWGPTPIQLGYENRHDLGNDLPGAGGPGNGRRWAGHGLIETTGYFNHLAVSNYFAVPMDMIVQWLQSPMGAARSAGLFLYQHNCNALADADDLQSITRKINPGMLGLADRRDRLQAIKKAQV